MSPDPTPNPPKDATTDADEDYPDAEGLETLRQNARFRGVPDAPK